MAMANAPSQLDVKTISVPLPSTLVAIVQNVSFFCAVIRDLLFFICALLSGKVALVDLHSRIRIPPASNAQEHVDLSALDNCGEDVRTGKSSENIADAAEETTKDELKDTKCEVKEEKRRESLSEPWKGSAIRELCRSIVINDFAHVFE